MKSQNKIIIVAILTIAFFTLIKVNDEIRAAQPDKPTCVAPANEAAFGEGGSIPLKSSAFSDPDIDDDHQSTTWTVKRYDSDEPAFADIQTADPKLTEYTMDIGPASPYYLPPGFKYVWQVKHWDLQGSDSEWSDECTFKVGDTIPESLATIAAGATLSDFGMISIVHWPKNPDPQAVFNIDYDPNNYRIGTWDPEQNKYIEFGHGLVMEPGKAYWVLARNPLQVQFSGVSVNTGYPVVACLHTHPSTGTGWNMIAPPNKANYRWNEVMVGRFTDDVDPIIVDPVPVTDPIASTLINHRIYEWKNGGYVDHRLDENFVLEHYKGYWVKAIVDGVYLEFNADAQEAGLSTPGTTMLAWKGKAVQWMKRLLPAPREAIADNDLPPMPMESFDGGTNPLFEGCFVQTLR
jgi:hypothetical protein